MYIILPSLFITWPKIFDFGQVLFSSAFCVCLCLPRLSQKVLDRFWWNLAGWCRMIKYRFLLKMGWIGLVEYIPHPFEILKSLYLTRFWINFNQTWQDDVYNNEMKISLKYEENRFKRTHTLPIWNFKIAIPYINLGQF